MSRISLSLVLTLLLGSQAVVRTQELTQTDEVEGIYVQSLKLIRDQWGYLDAAEERLERLEGIHRYVKQRIRRNDLSEEDRSRHKAEISFLEGQIKALKLYLRKDGQAYIKDVEKYLASLRSQYPQIAKWEKVRRALWRQGRPRLRLSAMPPGKVDITQPVRLAIENLPPGATTEWSASRGALEPDQEDPARACWWPRNTPQGEIMVRVGHPKLKLPVVLNRTLQAGGLYSGVEDSVLESYRNGLANLISMETGKEQNQDRLDEIEEKLRRARERRAPPDSAAVLYLQEQAERIAEDMERQQEWIDYAHLYQLPTLAEHDRSGNVLSWEAQRLDLIPDGKDGARLWPWRIQPGDRWSDASWHLVIPDLPPDTRVDWTLLSPGDSPRPLRGSAAEGVEVNPYRQQQEILSAAVKLRFHDLPVRMDWVLPANEPR